MRAVLAPLLLLSLAAQTAHARTWHVLNDGSGDAPTVQAGINSSSVGDTVLLARTYFENITLGKTSSREAHRSRYQPFDGSHERGLVVRNSEPQTSCSRFDYCR
jgi:hypothetical protein